MFAGRDDHHHSHPAPVTQQRCPDRVARHVVVFYCQLIALIASNAVPLVTHGRHDQRWIAVTASVLVVRGRLSWSCSALPRSPSWPPPCWASAEARAWYSHWASRASAPPITARRPPWPAWPSPVTSSPAAGPLLLGVLHDATDGWALPIALLGAVRLIMAVAGYGAGRARQVGSGNDNDNDNDNA